MIKAEEFLKDYVISQSKELIKDPKISIILPTYCRGNNGLLERSIESVLNQRFKEFELIIVDDGSQDNTQNVVRKFLEEDNRIVYIRNNINSGMPALRVNQGIIEARGKYICYQFDDDQWTENALEVLYGAISTKKEECVVYGKGEIIETDSGNRYVFGDVTEYHEIVKCNKIINNAVIHNRSLCYKYGAYDCHLIMRRLCDWDLWMRWMQEVPFYFIDELVSIIEAECENSLGKTCVYDINLTRMFFAHNRNKQLCLNNLPQYLIDDLSMIENQNIKEKAYKEHILPWLVRKQNLLKKPINYQLNKEIKNVLVTKGEYDTTVSICFDNYKELLSGEVNFIYIPEEQLEPQLLEQVDLVILFRTCSAVSSEFLNYAKIKGCPVIYSLDDNLLTMYTLGEELAYLAPGTALYNEVCYQITHADLVISYSQDITDSVEPLNEHVIQLATNIKEEYLMYRHEYNKSEITKIAFFGSKARKEEFKFIWEDLVNISKVFKDKVEFHFWGFKPDGIEQLESKVELVEFTTNYYVYLKRLQEAQFDIALCPLFYEKSNKAKSPIKYLEIASAKAVGIYSDVPVYDVVEDGVTGYKVKNEKGAWENKIKEVLLKDCVERDEIVNQSIDYVRKNYSTRVTGEKIIATLESSYIHNYLGVGTLCYVVHSGYLGGAENHLLRHALIAKRYKFNVMVCIPKWFENKNEMVEKICKQYHLDIVYCDFLSYVEPYNIDVQSAQYHSRIFVELCREKNIKLFHSCTLIPSLKLAADEMNIPYIASLYHTDGSEKVFNSTILPQVIHSDSVLCANRWSNNIGAISKCIRSHIPNSFFREECIIRNKKKEVNLLISGTLQERKGQAKVIKAIGMLKQEGIIINLKLLGYDHFFMDYKAYCEELIQQYHIESQIIFKGFCENMEEELSDIDALVCASDVESFPQAILEAMAKKVPIISTPVAGVPELIIDDYSGYLSQGYEVEDIKKVIEDFCTDFKENEDKLQNIIETAYTMVYRECNEDNVAKELFKLYKVGIDKLYYNKHTPEIYAETAPEIKVTHQVAPIKYVPLHLVASKPIKKNVSYKFNSTINVIRKIGIYFGTHGQSAKGTFNIIIKTNNGVVIRETSHDLKNIVDNQEYIMDIVPINEAKGQQFILEFVFIYSSGTRPISIYQTAILPKGYNRLNKKKQNKNILYIELY